MRMVIPDGAPGPMSDADIDAAYAWPVDTVGAGHWVRANMVSTLDGRGAGPDGLSDPISSPADKKVFGRLRGLADAIVVGAGTVRAENYRPARPKADFAERRAASGQRPAPVVAIVSRSLDLNFDAELFTAPAGDSDLARPLVLTCRTGNESRRGAAAAVCDLIDCGEEDVDLRRAVEALVDRGLPRIHSEGGPTLLARLAADGVLDELDLTLSPVLQGGDETRILTGPELPGAPRPMLLRHVLAADSMLFLRYVRAAS